MSLLVRELKAKRQEAVARAERAEALLNEALEAMEAESSLPFWNPVKETARRIRKQLSPDYIEWRDGPEFNTRWYEHHGCCRWMVPQDGTPPPTGTKECDGCAKVLPVRQQLSPRCGGRRFLTEPIPGGERRYPCPGCPDCRASQYPELAAMARSALAHEQESA